jgi:hypothetical protein
LSASASRTWASLPNVTARIPSSHHHCGIRGQSLRVFLRSLSAMAHIILEPA